MATKLRRRRITPKMRRAVYDRDNWRCFYCGGNLSGNPRRGFSSNRAIDHLIPFSKGGVDEFWNYVTTCLLCNSQKTDRTLEEFREYKRQKLFCLVRELMSNTRSYGIDDYVLRPLAEILIKQGIEVETLEQTFKFAFYGEHVWEYSKHAKARAA
jgi:hypothetical protein